MTAPTLVGHRVTLRAHRDDDRAARQRHGWHREIERGYGEDTPTRAMTDAEVEAWVDYLAAKTAVGAKCWAVECDGELVGHAFLLDVREAGRKARLAIGMYAPQFMGRGLGAEAVRLVLRYAFGTLGLHRVDLKVLDGNNRAIAAYRTCGFVEEGRERESCWVDGRWHDDVIMGILEHEFATADVERG
jgi:RimJ/RimL family protein N-acetyltransferase